MKVVNLWSNLQSEVMLPDWSALSSVLLSPVDELVLCCDFLAVLVRGSSLKGIITGSP